MARRFNAGNAGAATGAVQNRPMADCRLPVLRSGILRRVDRLPIPSARRRRVRPGRSRSPEGWVFGAIGGIFRTHKIMGRNCFVSFVKGWAGGA